MLMIIATLVIMSHATTPPRSGAICAAGAAAMRDLPSINHNPKIPAYFGELKPDRPNLLTICPKLRLAIPHGYSPADDDARERASGVEPMMGEVPRLPAAIYSVGIPKLSADGRHATVSLGYSCTGLCGAAYVGKYVRTRRGWVRDGPFQSLMVS